MAVDVTDRQRAWLARDHSEADPDSNDADVEEDVRTWIKRWEHLTVGGVFVDGLANVFTKGADLSELSPYGRHSQESAAAIRDYVAKIVPAAMPPDLATEALRRMLSYIDYREDGSDSRSVIGQAWVYSGGAALAKPYRQHRLAYEHEPA